MFLFVGLGNPGTQYLLNRHNLGFMAIDGLRQEHHFLAFAQKFNGAISQGNMEKHNCILLKPMTYMNLSGESVRAVDDYFKPDQIVVIHDDLDLPFGTVRFKIGGGHGGHNGLRSIDAHIGPEYIRVRIGIGKPLHKSDVAHYVLSDFSVCQREFLPQILLHVSKSVRALLTSDLKEVALQYSLKDSHCLQERE